MTLVVPAAVVRAAQQVADDIGRLGGVCVDAADELAGRAALRGFPSPGRISAGGASRLIAGGDGWWALTLSRADDVAAVPALLEVDAVPDDPWPALLDAAATRPAAELVARARLLGLPAARLGEAEPAPPTVTRCGDQHPVQLPDLLVVDLSAMWAGPLCGRILADAGATVVKVESPQRPDGTRADPDFDRWMNGGKVRYTVDLDDPALRELLGAADVVIESSRPGALSRRGLGPDDCRARPGRVWLQLSGYGADHPDRVAFGDDAAVAGGLVGDGPVFCGDAIADPLSGLEAARCVLASLADGGGTVIGLAMAAVAARYAALSRDGWVTLPSRRPSLRWKPVRQAGFQQLTAGRAAPC
ncbi:CoA transferase [Mycobacterium sp. MYCO198283]|uniref:CoA transferase n=1 Tax=Mycobacterium sp. MYCO198283 TaxID=2883505 RepID=UPI001E3F9081|nr:CoA transferase [Mycobacterium sp. MYCO198283]MCG5432018.1 CoA transferase [Mycobacterium sp. MYCO198283]